MLSLIRWSTPEIGDSFFANSSDRLARILIEIYRHQGHFWVENSSTDVCFRLRIVTFPTSNSRDAGFLLKVYISSGQNCTKISMWKSIFPQFSCQKSNEEICRQQGCVCLQVYQNFLLIRKQILTFFISWGFVERKRATEFLMRKLKQ